MVKGQLRKRIGYLALLTSLLMLRGLPAQERRPEDSTTPEKGTFALMEMYDQLGPFVVSVDGLGTRSESGTLTVEKPPEGSVRKAFLAAATTSFFRRFLMPGEVKLLGQDVVWQFAFPSDLSSFNHWAEVTDIVKPYLESQPAGRHELDVDEVDSEGIEGEILVVVFEVPPPANLSRIVLFFGSQDTSGARFGIEDLDLRGRFDPREERTLLDLGLGIASSFEPGEYTAVKVNDQPLTSRAGGADDGEAARGALLTVGGLGDDNANPLDLNDADDELYDLKAADIIKKLLG